MIISDTAVRNRTTVFFLTFLVTVAGLFCYFALPRESEPDVQIPHVFITTSYRGVAPEDIETSITTEIEDELKGLSGVKKITSLSSEGMSMIDVEFVTGTDIDDAIIKVKDKVDIAKPDLPPDLEDDPVVEEMNFSEMPILTLSLAGDCGLRRLTKIAEDLQDDITEIDGVLSVDLAGNVEREIQIEVFPERMALYGVPFSALQNIVSGENQNVSGGTFRTQEGRYQLRVPGEFKTVEEVETIVVATRGGAPVYLRDVARVVDGLKDQDSRTRVNGEPAVTLYIKKRAGENIIRIVEETDKLLERSRATWPRGVRVYRMMDKAKDIRNMLADLENNIISGLLLVVVVVCAAMGLRNAILVSLSIPLSMLISFIILNMMGITLNMVVLFSLTLALGMLVDNAIVIIENIYRYMQQGVAREEAARRATSEVAWPIIGSALTTIGAFVPMLWWDGIMGGFMIYLPKTVIITLVSCLFVALVINPAVAAVFMKAKGVPANEPPTDEQGWQDVREHPMLLGGGRVIVAYRRVLRFSLRYRLGVVALACVTTMVMFLFWMLRVGAERPVEFFPSIDPMITYVNLTVPKGAGLDYCDNLTKEAATRLYAKNAGTLEELRGEYPLVKYRDAAVLKPHRYAVKDAEFQSPADFPNTEFVVEKASTEASGAVFGGSTSATQVMLQFVDYAERSERTAKTVKDIAARMGNIAGAEVLVEDLKDGPPTGAPITIEISGPDFAVLGGLAERAKRIVNRVNSVKNVRDDYEEGAPTIRVEVDRKRAALLGLSTQVIGFAVKAAINGAIVSTYREQDDDYDIVVRFTAKDRMLIETLERTFIPSEQYGGVPLTTVARIEYVGSIGSISRINHNRVVTVRADIDPLYTTGSTARTMAEMLMQGSYELTLPDILDWPLLLDRLVPGASGGQGAASASAASVPALAAKIWDALPQKLKDKLSLARGQEASLSIEDRAALVDELNKLLKEDVPVLTPDDPILKGLPEETRILLTASASRSGDLPIRVRCNRALFEAAVGEAVARADDSLFVLPAGYRYEFTGENESQQESEAFLSWAMGVALLLILLILVAQFNSLLHSMIIMSAVLLSFAGVFWGLGICGMSFGVIMTGVGVISLAGVVVNNGIVLVDYIRLLKSGGMALDDAIVAAGATRLRPVMLTAVTTVLGLIPMATGVSFDFHTFSMQWGSESSQWWAGMAVAVIFGLTLATLLTLVVVPVLFSLSETVEPFLRRVLRGCVRPPVYRWLRQVDYKNGTDFSDAWK